MTMGMDKRLPKEVIEILNRLTKAGFQAYIVGGAVRDLLMGRGVTDWDFTTDAIPEKILQLFPEGFYDNKFGTVGIPVKKAKSDTTEVYEITTMRKEGVYQDSRHPTEIGWTNKVEEDLARRDFTINALAMDDKGGVTDLFGGQKDLGEKLVRAVGDPHQRFQEDALRLMRAVRISAQLEFDIENNTLKAIQKNAYLIKEVSTERVRDELFKLLASANPYIGIKKLREAGILEIILPEVERCFGISQEGPKHARSYDIGEHSLLTLKETPSSNPLVRLAALLHDIGKPDTFKVEADGNVTFYNHDLVSGQRVLNIAQRLHLSNHQTDKLYRLVRWHLYTVDEKQTDAAIRRFIKNVGLENIDDMLALRIGDRLGGGTQKAVSWRMEKFKERIKQVLTKPFTVADLKVTGHDVMEALNIPPSRRVGEVLDQLFQEVLEDDTKNNREYLVERLKSLK